MNKKRVMLTIPNFKTAGSQLVVLDILRSLNRSQFDPIVCVLEEGGIDFEVRKLDVPLLCAPFVIPIAPRRSLFLRARKAAKVFQKLAVDVWHSWHYLDDYSEPLIAYFSGSRNWIYTKKSMSWGSNGWHVRSFLARRIVVNNPLMVDAFFTSPFYRRKTVTIPQGVDIELFHPQANGDRFSLSAAFSLPANAVILGCVAKLVSVKDHITLIRGLRLTDDHYHLVLIGTGDEMYVAQLKALIKELKLETRVHFIDYIPNHELPAVLKQMDLFALTSIAEGLPVALLEAMACGVPCVATRCGGAEAVIEDGKNGFLVPVADYKKLAQAVMLLGENKELRAQFGNNGREMVVKQFNSETQGSLYSTLYSEL